MGSHGAVGHCRNNLAQFLGPYISHRIYTGKIGLRLFSSHDIAGVIQSQLLFYQIRGRLSANTDKEALDLQLLHFSANQIFHLDTGENLFSLQFHHFAVPDKADIGSFLQRLMIDLGCPQGIPPVN